MSRFPHCCHEPGCDSFETAMAALRLWWCADHKPAAVPDEVVDWDACTCLSPDLRCPIHDDGFDDVDFS